MNRGSALAGEHVAAGRSLASMRPRFMNRGSVFGGAFPSSGGAYASMRPRFMNRGSAASRVISVAARSRFNEAPIHESGKSRASIRMAGPMRPLQ